jgi:Fe-S cluster biogenesis protein NfuA
MSEDTKHELWDRVETALAMIRPNLAADGGNVKLINITEDNVVEVEMQGACKGCPMAQMTLSMGIGRVLRQEVPEVNDLRAVS